MFLFAHVARRITAPLAHRATHMGIVAYPAGSSISGRYSSRRSVIKAHFEAASSSVAEPGYVPFVCIPVVVVLRVLTPPSPPLLFCAVSQMTVYFFLPVVAVIVGLILVGLYKKMKKGSKQD